VIAAYEETLEAAIALAFFIPLLIDSGGNAGSQSATLMVRAIATKNVELSQWGRAFSKEIAVGLSLGIAMGLLSATLGIFRGGPEIGLIVGLAMIGIVLVANLVGTIGAFAISPLISGVLVAWWFTTDHWLATNIVGSLIAVLVIVRLGVDVSVGPIILLFGLLAVYDALAVYVTGHMVTLAQGIRELEIPLPMLLELPLEDSSGETITDGGEPMAVLGLGDIVIPGVVVVSATVFLPASGVIGIATLPALGAMTGAVAGLLTVFVLFDSGRAHAGLPPLFVGCVGGYLIGAVLSGVPISTALGLEVIA